MKTQPYISKAIKIAGATGLFTLLLVNSAFTANPVVDQMENPSSVCKICSNSSSEIARAILINELLVLSPVTPAEATFIEEDSLPATEPQEKEPVTPSEKDEFITVSAEILQFLAPTVPSEADFNDENR